MQRPRINETYLQAAAKIRTEYVSAIDRLNSKQSTVLKYRDNINKTYEDIKNTVEASGCATIDSISGELNGKLADIELDTILS